ncbi:MAG: hypothetical protein J6K16_05190 [Alphaproteobacteria bacterium]|nr:hypothetical protein [Alphaproteobacteria bacterium]
MQDDLSQVYDDFIAKHQDFARQLRQTYLSCKDTLPQTIEDPLYNAGTMQRDADNPVCDNIILANAHEFETHSETISTLPEAEQTKLRAQKVVDLLKQNGVEISPESMGNTLFYDNGNPVSREAFYADVIYNGAKSNTNYISRHIGNAQIICLPDSSEKLPKSAKGLPKEIMDKVDAIPSEVFKEMTLKRGLYHEAVHAALGTDDERKCDTFALLRVMKEHPEHAETMWEVYNFARSKSKYTIENFQKAATQNSDSNMARKVKNGTMTYLMPNTYKKLEQYAKNPELLQGKSDTDLLRMTFEITREPDFTHEQLTEFKEMCSKPRINTFDLHKSKIMRECMQQSGAECISAYLGYDTDLRSMITKQALTSARERQKPATEQTQETQPHQKTAGQSRDSFTGIIAQRNSQYS